MDWKQLEPSRVLITRLSAIGDCLATLPLAVEIKSIWPKCRLSWAVDCGAASLLERHPAVDEVIRIPKKWLKQSGKWRELRSILRAGKYDLAIDPQGLTKSSLLGWLSGARVRIGFDRSHARELAPWTYSHRVKRTARHMVDTYRQLLEPWRRTTFGTGEFGMPVYHPESEHVAATIDEFKLPSDWICINVGAGWPTKLWPPSRFAEVGRALYRSHGLRSIVLWSGEIERETAQQVVGEIGSSSQLAPPTTLPELAEWLSRARVVVSSDTGPAHLAAAVGTPCVVLFGPTWGDECGPYGQQHRVVQSIVMPPKGNTKRRGEAVAMKAIQVEEVVYACTDLLHALQAHRASA